MKKNTKLYLPIASDKKEILKKRAEDCGMNLTQYCLFILLNAKPKMEDAFK